MTTLVADQFAYYISGIIIVMRNDNPVRRDSEMSSYLLYINSAIIRSLASDIRTNYRLGFLFGAPICALSCGVMVFILNRLTLLNYTYFI